MLYFRQPDAQQLALVVPLVQRFAGVDALVALQPVQGSVQHLGQRLGGFGLAHPGFAFEQDRLREPQGQEQGGGQARVGHVVDRVQRRDQRFHVGYAVPDVRLAAVLRVGPRRRGHGVLRSAARTCR